MPKFDPIRDALDSPTVEFKPFAPFHQLPSHTQAAYQPQPPPPPPEPVIAPYAPSKRISPPKSIQAPLTQADLQRFLHPANKLRPPGTGRAAVEAIYERQGLMSVLLGHSAYPAASNALKRRRNASDAPNEPAPKRARDTTEVMNHCA